MRTATRLLVLIGVVTAALLSIGAPARAQLNLPDANLQEVLIKTTLLAFNDANITGNYAVLHAKTSKPFRDQFSPERLKEVFKEFAEKHIDFAVIAAKTPVPSQDSKIDDDGRLILVGYFDTTPSYVYYDLHYIVSEGQWKPIKINVDVKAPDKK